MAHRLKTVKYQNSSRKILLQNENGPCPLLACANALLLRGVVTLPSTCIRNGVASIDDVVNMLAERALKRAGEQAEAAQNATEWKEVSTKKGETTDDAKSPDSDPTVYHHESHEHQIDELLKVLPDLQFGMDVNPRFTQGPSGVEYTVNITAVDLLGVELVHGWLLDPQDMETLKLVGGKSYNELTELVIHGTEAICEVEKLSALIEEKEKMLGAQICSGGESSNDESGTVNASGENKGPEVGEKEKMLGAQICSKNDESGTDENEWVNVSDENKDHEAGEKLLGQKADRDGNDDTADVPALNNETASSPQQSGECVQSVKNFDDERIKAEKELEDLRKEHHEKSAVASNGTIVNSFLTSSGHQLTYHGLHELHNYLAEECLCVFFRNNHFATMTKHEGVLYLLATDLGYANVSEVVWEKLDSISGDTELFDDFFVRPKPRESLTAADGPALSPDALLAQRGRSEADYQLALQLSSRNGGRPRTREEMDEEEGKLIAAATEASLKQWNGDSSNNTQASNVAAAETPDNHSKENPDSQEDTDKAMAVALQAQMNDDHESSEMLARRLQDEENHRAAARRQQSSGNRPVSAMAPDRATQPSGSSCIIS